MGRRLLVALVVVAATGKLGRAEPDPEERRIPSRLGVDAMGGTGLVQMLGGAVRLEEAASPSSALTLRAGYLQARSAESESQELYPVYLVHGGYRRYAGWFYFAVEGGALVWNTDDQTTGIPSVAFLIGAKSVTIGTELGLSLMVSPVGFSLGAQLGLDFVTW